MKRQFIYLLTISLFLIISTQQGFAGGKATTGFGFRGNYWNIAKNSNQFRLHSDWENTDINVGGFGGTFYMFSRIQDQLVMEFSLGAIGAAWAETETINQTEVEVASVVPILMGLRFDLLSMHNRSNLQPYATAGVGAYWMNDVHVKEYTHHTEEVVISSSTDMGVYLGGGLNFMLGRNFAVNYDIKYHWVDFESPRYHNGFDFGLGLSIMWGDYRRY